MKRINKILTIISVLGLIFTSCSGEDGRDGFDGFDGENGIDGFNGIDGRDGDAANETIIYELAGLTFNGTNDFVINEAIPNDIFIDDSDIVIVYRLLTTDTNVGDIWEALPQLYFLDEGILQYNFSFSQSDLDFFMDADFDLNTFDDPSFTDDQIFRIAVIPASDNTSAKLLTSASSYAQIAKDATLIKVEL